MTAELVAITEAERLGVISAAAIVLAASIPACIAAWNSNRTRRVAERQATENTSQHGESQRLLQHLAVKIDRQSDRLEHVAQRIDHVAERVDHAHERITDHADKLERHVDDINERHGYRPGL